MAVPSPSYFAGSGAGHPLPATRHPDLLVAKGKNSLGLERFLHSNAS
jgi:hypothetical protein